MTGDSVPARTTTRGTASGKLRTWARSVLTGEWTEDTVLDVVVVLEELANHVCRGGRPAQVRLSYRTGNRLRIEVDDERAVPRSLGSDIGALLVRHLARDSGVRRWRRGVTFWADVALVASRVPGALPGGVVLGPFEPGARSPN
ncbi:hypothetical protein LWP59_22440 [Amycolatopsis acidiphila]|uniref:ATP-binding protein n=1 Tax=Amycolatopsis acidiphila TaxID=715473 RepID=A0A558A5D1_9PSEU|nr:hypothetical protein [Amycolatopsis acidiphila]TVT19489.1 hypothetical protein FNH06_23900 [Amycolatopsis acidiphila]UIJ56922.1 hypothetical protein LWP59_22440 [Amycolatopsis acidiphila]GHG54328.1 hypothetical protein GCM10017788_03940 [Amycolatopsis acidiphila]